jgi:membrane protease YdiL (CAAX protease family)
VLAFPPPARCYESGLGKFANTGICKQWLARKHGDDTISKRGETKKGAMLFYIKRHLWLEITVTILLASLGLWGDAHANPAIASEAQSTRCCLGIVGAAWLGVWTLLVQYGYRVVKGSAFAEQLTASLAKEYANPSPAQILLGGITASCGGEIFRGFIQQWLGLIVASLLFMVAHFGRKDIRVVSYWSIFQGLYLGLFFAYSKNLMVPMIAHELFDMGGMVYFRSFMLRLQNKQV